MNVVQRFYRANFFKTRNKMIFRKIKLTIHSEIWDWKSIFGDFDPFYIVHLAKLNTTSVINKVLSPYLWAHCTWQIPHSLIFKLPQSWSDKDKLRDAPSVKWSQIHGEDNYAYHVTKFMSQRSCQISFILFWIIIRPSQVQNQ